MDHIKELISEYDSSFFYYDLDQFEQHLRNIKEALDPRIKIFYACKANPLSKILSILNDNGFGVDVASLGELHQARSVGVENLIATGPAKSYSYLNKLMNANVETIVCESPQQLKDLNELCLERRSKQKVLLRVQLDWEGEKSVLGGSAITPFGLGPGDWKKESLQEYPNLEIIGFHCFQWGNILAPEKFRSIWKETIGSLLTLGSDMGAEVKVLDFGGGLGISYQNGPSLAFSEVHAILVELMNENSLPEVWLELGRFSIGEFGSYFTKIVDIKEVRGRRIIVTDGGINHIARPALVSESFPCNAFDVPKVREEKFHIHGPLCTALDYLGEHSLPHDLKAGNWLEFKKTGAYGFTESMPFFLCHNLAGEAYLHRGEVKMIRKPSFPQWMV
jgi:diaminopimelate decarboxylase